MSRPSPTPPRLLQVALLTVCDELIDHFKRCPADDPEAELVWYRGAKEYFEDLRDIHRKYAARRHIAAELRRKNETENLTCDDN